MSPTPPVDYSSRDYDAIRADLLAAKQTILPEWTSTSPNDFGVVLIELFSYVGDMLSFYADRIANEAFLDTAVQRSSVYAIARMLDYAPTGNVAATTTLQFTLQTGSGSVTIPQGTQVQTVAPPGESPIIFETDTAVTIPGATVTPAVYIGTVTATQGVTVSGEAVATSDGSLDQQYTLFNSPVITGSVIITVDEGNGALQWTPYDHIIDAGPTDNAYSTFVDENGITNVLFGDNVNGRAPVSGGLITATYRVGAGEAGNVGLPDPTGSTSGIVQLTAPVVINGVTQPVASVQNTVAATGGADAESLDSIRTNAPKSLTTINRAVTLADYAALALRVAGVGKANAAAAVYTSVTLYIAPAGGGIATTALRTAVQNYMATRKMINTTVTLADPTYVSINVTATVNVLPTYKQSVVQTNVITAIKNVLAFDNVDFGDRISLSSIYHAINNTEGVDYATVTVLSTTGSGLADVVVAANQIPQAGTITVTPAGGIL